MIMGTPAIHPYRLNLMHASLEVFDPGVQQHQDITDLFRRAATRRVAWITGTEAGKSGAGGQRQRAILDAKADLYGYRLGLTSSDAWIAVDRDLIRGNWTTDYEKVIDSGKGHGHRGVVSVSFDATFNLGGITIMAAHYLTKKALSREEGNENRLLTKAIGRIAQEAGAGPENTVWFGGDTNIVDRHRDVFMGEPLTTAWDELKKWEPTGHGNIDVIASYDGDERVSAAYCRSLNDEEFRQHGDHFVVEAGFDIMPLATIPRKHKCPTCGKMHPIPPDWKGPLT